MPLLDVSQHHAGLCCLQSTALRRPLLQLCLLFQVQQLLNRQSLELLVPPSSTQLGGAGHLNHRLLVFATSSSLANPLKSQAATSLGDKEFQFHFSLWDHAAHVVRH